MIGDAGRQAPSLAFLYVYVSDVDLVFKRAVNAGVVVIEQPFETPYGDRRCMFEDQSGNTWQVATYRPA
jgi:uncharacterized glyoxalase superfamily protein PhnB